MIRPLIPATILVTALMTLLGATSFAGAQEGSTTIGVDAELREIGRRYFGGYLQVYADGQLCGELSFTDPAQRTADGGSAFELAVGDQPSVCGRGGATLSFFDGRLVALANKYTLELGTSIDISWFLIPSLREGLDDGATTDGRTVLTIDPELREAGADRPGGYLDVFADGELCGELSFTNAEQRTADYGAQLELARAEQPSPCARDGAVITLFRPDGVRLAAVYRLTVGHRIPIQNFTIPPPTSGPGENPAPGAPAAGAGLVAEPSRSAGRAVVGIGTVLLLAVAVLYVVLRRTALR